MPLALTRAEVQAAEAEKEEWAQQAARGSVLAVARALEGLGAGQTVRVV